MPDPGALGDLGRVLSSIADSTSELRPVLSEIAAEARRLCEADGAFSFVRRGERLVLGGSDGVTDEFWAWMESNPPPINHTSAAGRAVLSGAPVRIDDAVVEPGYGRPETVTIGNYRSILAVPIRSGDEVIGGFVLARHALAPFSDPAVEVATVFADQAAIAIRIANLLAAGREAQDRESSLGAVLASIARTSFDQAQVLQTVIDEATRLCDGATGNIAVRQGEAYRIVATTGFPEEYRQAIRGRDYTPERGSVIGRTLVERGVVQIPDVLADPEYVLRDLQAVGGYRSTAGVPIWFEGDLIGVIAVGRSEVRPFSDRQVTLLQAFADQVAIALNLARLLAQTREALERESAVSSVLQSISRTTFDLDQVLQTVIESATRLSHADEGNILREENGRFRIAAYTAGVAADFRAVMDQRHFQPERGSLSGRVLMERAPVQIVDVTVDPEFTLQEFARMAGMRTLLGVPLMRDGSPIGLLIVWRVTVQPFAESEIALLTTFADQAALAISNVGLFQTVERQRTELARYAPQVADLLTSAEGEALLAGHRREISAMFCDLRGFTAFAEGAEPEELLDVIRAYHAAVGELSVAAGGTVEHFAGDGLMVFFNDPAPVPDHQLVTVRTACAIRDRFSDLAVGWRKRGYELGMGIGIASGYATMGRIGFEGRYDYGAMGIIVNLAARLSDVAQGGEILISQRHFASVDEFVEAGERPPVTLKGFGRPVPVWAVESVRGEG